MRKFCGCAINTWDNVLSVSLFYFVLVALSVTQARVSPFAWSRRISQKSRTSKDVNESGVVNRFKDVRDGLERFSYLELMPNGTAIVRGSIGKGTNMQNILLHKDVLESIKTSPRWVVGNSKKNIKIYGDSIEQKFPPFLEHIIQRIQTYFSIYKYADTSAVETSTVSGENISSHVDSISTGVESTTQEDKNQYTEFIEIGEHDADVIVVGMD